MIIHEIIVKEKLKQNSTIAGHYLQSASKPNVSSLVVFGIKKKKNEFEKRRIADGFFAEHPTLLKRHTRALLIRD